MSMPLLRFAFRLSVLLIISLFSLIHASNVGAVDYTETFNGSLSNPSFWETTRGNILFDSILNRYYGVMQVPDGTNPFYYFKSVNFNALKPDYSSVNLTVKFSSNAINQGAGYIISDNVPSQSSSLLFTNYLFYVWPKPNGTFHIFSSLCPDTNPLCNVSSQLANGVYAMPIDENWHNISVKRLSSHYEWFVDNVVVFRTVDTNRIISSIGIGDPEDTGGLLIWPSLFVDFVGLDVDQEPSAPTFPYFSQKDPLWKDIEYDTAGTWAPGRIGIGRWGCAITSVAMILKNYGIDDPDGTEATPDKLNTWLLAEPDGYIGDGRLNWLAVTRYVKESFDAGQAETKLEFSRTSTLPETLPAILGEPGHFVVAHASGSAEFNINDPNDATRTAKLKTDPIVSSNIYTPSLTDLSYMFFVTSPEITTTLVNESGEIVDMNWINEYLADDGGDTPSSTIRTGLFSKPASGKYRLTINQPEGSSNDFQAFLYDDQGETTPQTFSLTMPITYLEIEYASGSAETRTITEIDLTPPAVPTLIYPGPGAHVKPTGLVLDWTDERDPSGPVTYKYKSSWPGGSYGPVSTGNNSFISAPGTPDQVYEWQVQACDNVNNCSEWTSARELTVDSVSPSVDLIFPTPGVTSNYFEAIFSELVDPVEATRGANYYLSNWPGAGGSGDLEGDAQITYLPTSKTARVIFTNLGWYISPEQLWGVQNISDLAGNLLTINPYSEYSTPMIPPTLANLPTTTPNPSSQIGQLWSWMAGSDGGSGIGGYSTRTFNAATEEYLNDWLWIGDVLSTTTNLAEGKWQLNLKAKDSAGNESETESSETVVVDTTAPVLSAQTTLNETWYKTIPTVTFEYSDENLKDDYVSPTCEITTESSASYCWVKPYICDTAGNCNNDNKYSANIKLDLTKPTITLMAWGSTINGTAADGLSGLEKVVVKITKPGETEASFEATGTTTWTYTMQSTPIGHYKIVVEAFDKANNGSEEVVKEFDINASDPAQSPSTPTSTPTSTPISTPTPTPSATFSSTPNPSPAPSPNPSEEILGETTISNKMSYRWVWLMAPISLIAYLLARKK